jgi:hypothetical protein
MSGRHGDRWQPAEGYCLGLRSELNSSMREGFGRLQRVFPVMDEDGVFDKGKMIDHALQPSHNPQPRRLAL